MAELTQETAPVRSLSDINAEQTKTSDKRSRNTNKKKNATDKGPNTRATIKGNYTNFAHEGGYVIDANYSVLGKTSLRTDDTDQTLHKRTARFKRSYTRDEIFEAKRNADGEHSGEYQRVSNEQTGMFGKRNEKYDLETGETISKYQENLFRTRDVQKDLNKNQTDITYSALKGGFNTRDTIDANGQKFRKEWSAMGMFARGYEKNPDTKEWNLTKTNLMGREWEKTFIVDAHGARDGHVETTKTPLVKFVDHVHADGTVEYLHHERFGYKKHVDYDVENGKRTETKDYRLGGSSSKTAELVRDDNGVINLKVTNSKSGFMGLNRKISTEYLKLPGGEEAFAGQKEADPLLTKRLLNQTNAREKVGPAQSFNELKSLYTSPSIQKGRTKVREEFQTASNVIQKRMDTVVGKDANGRDITRREEISKNTADQGTPAGQKSILRRAADTAREVVGAEPNKPDSMMSERVAKLMEHKTDVEEENSRKNSSIAKKESDSREERDKKIAASKKAEPGEIKKAEKAARKAADEAKKAAEKAQREFEGRPAANRTASPQTIKVAKTPTWKRRGPSESHENPVTDKVTQSVPATPTVRRLQTKPPELLRAIQTANRSTTSTPQTSPPPPSTPQPSTPQVKAPVQPQTPAEPRGFVERALFGDNEPKRKDAPKGMPVLKDSRVEERLQDLSRSGR